MQIGSLTKRLLKHWRALLLIALDIGIFSSVNPRNAPSAVLMIGFVLLVGTVYVLISFIVNSVVRGWPAVQKQSKKLKIFLASIATFLVGLQSIGQLTAKDSLAVVPLLLVGYFYLSYPAKKSDADTQK